MISEPPEDYSFLVDVNLPKWFSFFNNKNFTHVVDINPQMKDDEIWNYAIENQKVILTKDADFYNKSITSVIAPKVIQFQLGNMTLAELHLYFEMNWETIISHLDQARLIIATKKQVSIIF